MDVGFFMLNVSFSENELGDNAVVAVLIDDQLLINNQLMMLDQKHHGLISKTIKDKRSFLGKFAQTKVITTTSKHGELAYIILVGTGNEKKLKSSCIEKLGGKILSTALSLKSESIGVKIANGVGDFDHEVTGSLIASGALLASYKFDKYFTKQKEEDKTFVKSLEILVKDKKLAEHLFIEKKAIAMGVFLARDCISEPPNILYPESYSEIIIKELEHLGVEVEVFGEREMRNLGMGAIIGVGQGSQNESKLVIMKYIGTNDNEMPIVFVGKGVTFDSGGISLKPSAGMADMKYDMAGSAAVVGAMKAIALRSAKTNVIGVIGLVENMPSGQAQRPSDVVTSMSGQTIEVLDTDAEGRLVLADAIWYAQDKFKPQCVIDLATLTGAIVVALGNTYAGIFANNEELADRLIKAGDEVDEKLWRMPLHSDYDEMIKSEIADIANLGNIRGAAASSTAAQFIGRFIQEGVNWAHLDIAGMAWEKKGAHICPKGAAGYGVRLLNKFVQDYYESK